MMTQDVETIWGKDCRLNPCQYQSWKIRAGHFTLVQNEDSLSNSVLRIRGCGLGSRWHITWEWPKPSLSPNNIRS